MSKIEIVKGLSNSAQQPEQQPETLKLQQEIADLRTELSNLPEAIATAIQQAVAPITPDMTNVLGTFNEIMAHQRKALDELTTYQRAELAKQADQLTKEAVRKFAEETEKLTEITDEFSFKIKPQISDLTTEKKIMCGISDHLQETANRMEEAAKRILPRWKQVIMLLLAGVIGALLAGMGREAGENVLYRFWQPIEVKTDADMFRKIGRNATPQEKKLLNQIIARPEK